jgi:fused signal recognition particle receptor
MTQPAEIIQTESTELPVVYQFTVEEVRLRLAVFRDIDVQTPAGYKTAVRALAVCRSLRGDIESRRKELKAGALEYGRRVDSAARELCEAVGSVELPLKEDKSTVDAEKARLKAEREEAERVAREAEIARKLAEEQARQAAEAAAALATTVAFALDTYSVDDWIAAMEDGHSEYTLGDGQTTLTMGAAERAHPLVVTRETQCREIIRERRAAEQARLDAERAELDRQRQELEAERARQAAAQAEQERVALEAREAEEMKLAEAHAALEAASARQRAEARADEARIAAQQHRLDEQKRLAEFEEAERRTAERAARAAAEQADRDRVASEEAAVAEAERQAELQRRREALRPDRERVQAWVAALQAVTVPDVTDAEARGFVQTLREALEEWRGEAERIGESDG